ncbi:hypothetical protein ACCS96_02420, partial [Rhizobium ruizarguesonis]
MSSSETASSFSKRSRACRSRSFEQILLSAEVSADPRGTASGGLSRSGGALSRSGGVMSRSGGFIPRRSGDGD